MPVVVGKYVSSAKLLTTSTLTLLYRFGISWWNFVVWDSNLQQAQKARPLKGWKWHHALCDKIQEAHREAFSIFGCRCTCIPPSKWLLYAVVLAVAWLDLPAACPLCKKKGKANLLSFLCSNNNNNNTCRHYGSSTLKCCTPSRRFLFMPTGWLSDEFLLTSHQKLELPLEIQNNRTSGNFTTVHHFTSIC